MLSVVTDEIASLPKTLRIVLSRSLPVPDMTSLFKEVVALVVSIEFTVVEVMRIPIGSADEDDGLSDFCKAPRNCNSSPSERIDASVTGTGVEIETWDVSLARSTSVTGDP